MKTKILLSILFGVFVLVACKKEPPIPETIEPVMPPLTHQGLNTFGCYINGELFVASAGKSYWDLPPVNGGFYDDGTQFRLQGIRYTYPNNNDFENYIYEDIRMVATIDHGVGDYDFEIFDGGTRGYSIAYATGCNYYYKDIPNLGKLTINYFDIENRIIAGTFFMNLVNSDCAGDTLLKVTDGRFDFNY
jgi:hypothetical protein